MDRAETGRSLSDLVERIETPMVIAVDGDWGTGKTVFLKRWVGAHRKQFSGRATTVYIDAFAQDYLDDPLTAILSPLLQRLPKGGESNSVASKLKQAAPKLARASVRVGLAAVTSGLSELAVGAVNLGKVADQAAQAAVRKAGSDADAAANGFWKAHDERQDAMDQLREALRELTQPQDDGGAAQPLVVVVDELDRCRPDYALSLLEVIKHVFSVANVHFVLGVNLVALRHSVHARYGAGMDAPRYLQRFITLSLSLPMRSEAGQNGYLALAYFEREFAQMVDRDAPIFTVGSQLLSLLCRSRQLSLRDVQRLMSRFVLLPFRMKGGYDGISWTYLTITLAAMKELSPELFTRAAEGGLAQSDVTNFLGINSEMIDSTAEGRSSYDHGAFLFNGVWRAALGDPKMTEEERSHFGRFGDFDRPRDSRVTSAITQYLDRIELLN
ncbi:P-loop NTPase fold protein [Paracoccus sp. p4-l81]|uniref:KAP family P-loop NTPase fold protein n=1 Tax=Paracoccus sp. p4-l81 TaxID=3342806 RepID=UPI0035BB977C